MDERNGCIKNTFNLYDLFRLLHLFLFYIKNNVYLYKMDLYHTFVLIVKGENKQKETVYPYINI